jgi:hypothetical protein
MINFHSLLIQLAIDHKEKLPLSIKIPIKPTNSSLIFRVLALLRFSCLRRQTFRVAWEHRSLADIVQAEVQHDDTFHSDAAASVWWTAEAEGFDVCGDFGNVCGNSKKD